MEREEKTSESPVMDHFQINCILIQILNRMTTQILDRKATIFFLILSQNSLMPHKNM